MKLPTDIQNFYFIMLLTVVVFTSCVLPNIMWVINITGSTTVPFMIFIVPGWLYYTECKNRGRGQLTEQERRWKWYGFLFAASGFV